MKMEFWLKKVGNRNAVHELASLFSLLLGLVCAFATSLPHFLPLSRSFCELSSFKSGAWLCRPSVLSGVAVTAHDLFSYLPCLALCQLF